ncbi:hypothetical protein [Dysgonomonas sp. BGC7]|uniref:hypothetical protein n=1 Tax=Dysgonomonas sp. BGC7 TaxID=1658008 RepID=UPI00068228B6|nr:hypothetical protein [Dysgonomonas sp. BGC7]MBD8388636.1 hypothetical protein [Dysgonomonas sp. BGC7]
MTRYNSKGEMTAQFTFFNDGSSNNEYGAVVDAHGNLMADDNIIYGKDFTIFGTSDNSVNAETLHGNLLGTSYTGGDNPMTYGNSALDIESKYSYEYKPRNRSEYGSIVHDNLYDKAGAAGSTDAFFNTKVRDADLFLVGSNIANAIYPGTSLKDRGRSIATAILFNWIYQSKRIRATFGK